MSNVAPFTLPELSYEYDALAGLGMSQHTVTCHYDKHHRTYVNNLNSLLATSGFEITSNVDSDEALREVIIKSFASNDPVSIKIFNNAAQHWNHIQFWKVISPTPSAPSDYLAGKISHDFGTFDNMIKQFVESGTAQFGSGWCWLVENRENSEVRFEILTTKNAENPLVGGGKYRVLLGCDVWEHSYYLDYQNKRADYIENFLRKLVDWEHVENIVKS